MIRKAFKMKLDPGKAAAYAQRHNPIWPELLTVLKEHGASNYNIFLDEETHILFAYVELESEERWEAIAHTEVCKKWWAYMADLMETHDDNSPVSKDLKGVFYME